VAGNPNWLDHAACANHDHLDWFDMDCGIQQTLAICHSCTVKTECLNVAIKHRYLEGIWGGLHGRRLYAAVTRHRRNRGAHATLDD
jgi:ribonuclease I